MSFFKRKKEEPKIPPPTTGAYGSSSSYADDYGPDEYSGSAYSRSGGLQPGQPAGSGRSVSPSGYGSQPYGGGRSRYDTPDDPSEYSYSSTAVSSRPNVLQKGKSASRGAPTREDAEYDDSYSNTAYKSKSTAISRDDPVGDAKKRDLLFAGATVKPTNKPPAGQYSGGGAGDGDEDEFEDEESIQKATDRTRDETIRVLGDTLTQGRQMMTTAVNTNNRLREQGEQLGATERHFISAEGHVNRAADNIGDIKSLNRSIFIPSFVSDNQKKRDAQERERLARYEKERGKREKNYDFEQSQRAIGGGDRDPYGRDNEGGPPARGYGRGARAPMPDDDEDDSYEGITRRKEGVIDDMTNELESLALGLHQQVKQMGQRVDDQNQMLRRQEKHVENLDQNVSRQTERARRL